MDSEKLIEQLRKSADFEDYPIVASFAAIIEKKYLRDAATALSTLQTENNGLKEKLYDGEGVNLVDYWMQQAKIEENGHRNCQAENEKLRAELEQVKRENDALWTYIEIVDREYRRYMDRGYIDRLDELKKVWKRGQKED